MKKEIRENIQQFFSKAFSKKKKKLFGKPCITSKGMIVGGEMLSFRLHDVKELHVKKLIHKLCK